MSILSKNKKTGVSLNLPTTNCRPTAICKFCCYGRHHFLGHGKACQDKWQRNSDYLEQSKDCSELISEARNYTAVRLSGVGDILPTHVENLLLTAKKCPQTQFWGMTRKPELAEKLNNKLKNLKVLVTADAESYNSLTNYKNKICFGPRRAQDSIPNDPRIITVFPYHNSGHIVNQVPEHKLDCPAVRHKVSGCNDCGKCWKW